MIELHCEARWSQDHLWRWLRTLQFLKNTRNRGRSVTVWLKPSEWALLRAIADAKGEIFQGLEAPDGSPGGVAIVPYDSPHRDRLMAAAPAIILKTDAHVRPDQLARFLPTLQAFGEHLALLRSAAPGPAADALD